MKAGSELKLCLAILAIVVLLQSLIGSPHMYSTETSHPGSFDSFVCPPTCTARNFHLRKIYEASTNKVSPVISPDSFFLKIITSIHSSAGLSLLAPALPVCLNTKPWVLAQEASSSTRHSSPICCYLPDWCWLR